MIFQYCLLLTGFCEYIWNADKKSQEGEPSIHSFIVYFFYLIRNRIRVTNNMLSDCYAAVIVERFSKKELRELDKLTEAEDNNPISDSK